MSKSMRMDENVPMEMRDGTVLRADVYRPDDNSKHPAILIRTPYNKMTLRASDMLNPINATLAGFTVIHQDIRGRFASEGEYRYEERFGVEGPDGYDSVEWIANQPWCDGNVGVAGASYMGFLAWATAIENPPHLKAIAPWMIGASSIHEVELLTGATMLEQVIGWTAQVGLGIADKLEKQGKDVSKMREMLLRAMLNPEEVYHHLPLKNVPHFQFEGVKEIWEVRVMRAIPKSAEDVFLPYQKINVPCLQLSGWYDYFIWGTINNFLGMREKGGSKLARDSQHVLLGPWKHGSLQPSFVGAISFGPAAGALGAQVTERNIAFFNKYLRGIDINIPTVRYFVMGKNIWKESENWPPPQVKWQRFFLHSKSHANNAEGDGLLNQDEPESEPADIFVYDPHFPVPANGGRFAGVNIGMGGPIDQYHIEKRGDVLCYTTPVLEQNTEVTGPLKLHLFASTSARDTDFTATIVDVYPDGEAYNIANSLIRARYRKSILEPELVNPGEVYEYTINLAHASTLFRKEHRIRIDISSSSFPQFDRNMNTGNPIGEDVKGIPATQTIYHEGRYASYIDLPTVPSS